MLLSRIYKFSIFYILEHLPRFRYKYIGSLTMLSQLVEQKGNEAELLAASAEDNREKLNIQIIPWLQGQLSIIFSSAASNGCHLPESFQLSKYSELSNAFAHL